jgi:polyisoprenoid-binding protein YceI
MLQARRRWACPGLALGLILAIGAQPACAGLLNYVISQHYGSVGFTVSQLGLFSVDGHFTRFKGELAIDAADPTQTQIDVTIDAGSASMASPDAVAMLRSPAFFDVARYPAIHFKSQSITQMAKGHFIIRGLLTIRGVARPQSLQATLVDEKKLGDKGAVADFRVTGDLNRSAFGMTANENFIGDKVQLSIFIRLSLNSPVHGG